MTVGDLKIALREYDNEYELIIDSYRGFHKIQSIELSTDSDESYVVVHIN